MQTDGPRVLHPVEFHHSGATSFFASQHDQRFSYCLYVPTAHRHATRPLPLVVIVHGTGRNAERYRGLYADFAEERGCIVLAPLFPAGVIERDDLHGFKRLMFHDIRFDQELLAMIDEAGERYRVATQRFLLHGYSGGGQFSHRFAYVHPDRLAAVSIGAPGRVTRINPEVPWWLATADLRAQFGRDLDLAALRRLSVHMIVGDADTETWEIAEPGLDAGGATHVERLTALRHTSRSTASRWSSTWFPACTTAAGWRCRTCSGSSRACWTRRRTDSRTLCWSARLQGGRYPVMSATKAPSAATLDERVAARLDDLSAAERRVARYLADSKAEVAFASAETLGRLTETSDATVIRTVKALGYSGLPALKRTLQESIRERLGPAGRLGRSLDKVGSDPQTVLARVLAESVELLEEAQRTIDPEAFAEAVRLISGARETVVVAAGGLGVLGDYLRLRLVRTGRSARTALASGYLLADDLLRLNQHDVVVVIAHQFLVREMDVALDRAAKVGAKVVLITDALGDALADRVTVSVSGPIGDTDMFSVQATTLAILDSISLAVSAHDRKAALRALDDMNRLRKELRGEDGTSGASRRRRRNGRAPAK